MAGENWAPSKFLSDLHTCQKRVSHSLELELQLFPRDTTIIFGRQTESKRLSEKVGWNLAHPPRLLFKRNSFPLGFYPVA